MRLARLLMQVTVGSPIGRDERLDALLPEGGDVLSTEVAGIGEHPRRGGAQVLRSLAAGCGPVHPAA